MRLNTVTGWDLCTRKVIALGSPQQLKTEQAKGELIEVICSDFTRARDLLTADARYNRVSLFGNAIHVRVNKDGLAIQDIKTLLEQSGIQVTSIGLIPFTMEDVFISLIETERSGEKGD